MKSKFIALFLGLIYVICVRAQVTVKKDISKYYSLLPSMPVSLEQAYKVCYCKLGACNADSLLKPLKQTAETDAKAIGTLSSQESSDTKKGTAIGAKMQNDGVQGMNDNQKLEYVKNNPQLNGGNQNAIAFAEKMKNDPAEKAKLQAMTPEQKIAYLQQNGVMQPVTPQNSFGSGASSNAADALKREKQMQDSETTAGMNKLIRLMERQLNRDTLDKIHAGIDKQMDKEIKALPPDPRSETHGPTKEATKAVIKSYMQRHIDLATKEMMDMGKTFNKLAEKYAKAEEIYCNALALIDYGYNNNGQDPNITKLAVGQTIMLDNVEKMAGYAKSIYEFGADWWDKFLKILNEK